MLRQFVMLAVVVFSASGPLAGQPLTSRVDSPASAALKEAEASLGSASALTLGFEGTVVDKRPDRGSKTTYRGSAKLMKPNLAWIEYEMTILTQETEAKSKWLIVSDGKMLWRLDVQRNTYHKRPVDADGRNILSAAALPANSALAAFFVSSLPHSTTQPVDKGEQSIGGTAYRVVQFEEGEANSEGIPLRRQRYYLAASGAMRFVNEQLNGNYVADFTFSDTVRNPSIPAGQFTYAPPASAEDTTPPEPKMIADGSVAPDFLVRTPAGKPLKLSDFRGKIVALDFWSVTCGPCIESREHLN